MSKPSIIQRFGTTRFGQALGRSLAQLTANFTRGLDLNDAGLPSSFTRPMAQSAWVHAAVSKVAGPIAAVELCFSENDEEIEDEAFTEFWRNPAINPDGSLISAADFRDISASWLLLRGEVFYLLDDSWALPFPEVAGGLRRTPLIILRPDRMRHVVRGGELQEWVLTDAAGRQIHLPLDRVVHIKRFNPYDPWRGLGNLEAAMIAAGGDYAAGLFAKNTAEANGDQGVYIVAKGGLPGDEQREQIIAQLREKRSAQQRGIFRPAFLTGDISIEDPKIRSVDVAFVTQRQEARKEIAAAFGVPPSFFDPQASYSIGSASDRYILIEETCKPLGTKLCGGWAFIGSRLLGRRIEAELDWDDHSVMQQVRRERLDGAIKLWNVGMPMREVSDYLGLDLPEYAGWDVGYLPFSVAPVGATGETMAEPTTDPTLSEGDAASTDPVQEMLRALRSSGRSAAEAKASNAQLWRSHMQRRRSTVKAFESKVTKALLAARTEILRKLESSGLAKSQTRNSSVIEILFDFKAWDKGLTAVLGNLSKATLEKAGTELFQEIGKDDPWKMPMPEAIQFLNERENVISQANAGMWQKVKDSLVEGLNEGDTLKELSARVRAEFNHLSDYEAKRIALTETGAAYGAGRQQAMEDAGVQFKSWLSSHGPNVRAAHRAAEIQYAAQPIPVDEPFIVGGEQLMYPGDPSGSPGNVINCQCIQIAVAPPENSDT